MAVFNLNSMNIPSSDSDEDRLRFQEIYMPRCPIRTQNAEQKSQRNRFPQEFDASENFGANLDADENPPSFYPTDFYSHERLAKAKMETMIDFLYARAKMAAVADKDFFEDQRESIVDPELENCPNSSSRQVQIPKRSFLEQYDEPLPVNEQIHRKKMRKQSKPPLPNQSENLNCGTEEDSIFENLFSSQQRLFSVPILLRTGNNFSSTQNSFGHSYTSNQENSEEISEEKIEIPLQGANNFEGNSLTLIFEKVPDSAENEKAKSAQNKSCKNGKAMQKSPPTKNPKQAQAKNSQNKNANPPKKSKYENNSKKKRTAKKVVTKIKPVVGRKNLPDFGASWEVVQTMLDEVVAINFTKKKITSSALLETKTQWGWEQKAFPSGLQVNVPPLFDLISRYCNNTVTVNENEFLYDLNLHENMFIKASNELNISQKKFESFNTLIKAKKVRINAESYENSKFYIDGQVGSVILLLNKIPVLEIFTKGYLSESFDPSDLDIVMINVYSLVRDKDRIRGNLNIVGVGAIIINNQIK